MTFVSKIKAHPTNTPDAATELRQAAETLRTRAAAADVAPWKSDDSQPGDVVIFNGEGEWTTNVGSGRTYASGVVCFDHEKANGSYIATMHPGVGLALANLLDETASREIGIYSATALRLARLINGENA